MKKTLLPLFVLLSCARPSSSAVVRGALGQTLYSGGEGYERFYQGFVRGGYYVSNKDHAAAARPDGTGTASYYQRLFVRDLLRGENFAFLADGVALGDRDGSRLRPTQLDYLLGLASRGENGVVQFDREELLSLDHPDQGRAKYWDVRVAYHFGGGKKSLPLRGRLGGGYFLDNDGYSARGDGTGEAFFRYNGALEAGFPSWGLKFAADADLLTDRWRRRYAPASLELSLGVGAAYRGFELMIRRETSDVLDGKGYAARYLLTVEYPFATR